MKLYAHQKKVIESQRSKLCLAHETGTGKTLTLLSLVEKYANNALIICPKGMREQWKVKIKEYGITKFCDVITKEEHRRDFQKLRGYDAVVIDEVHFFSGNKSQMHKNLIHYLRRTQPRFVWSGTATTYRSEPFNIWALGVVHNYMPLNWMQFRNKFYHERYLGRRIIWEKNEGDEVVQQLHEYMQPWVDFILLDDCFDMPEQIDEEPEMLGLTKEQEKAIAELKNEEMNPLVMVSGTHQIENGSLKGNEFRVDKHYKHRKIDRIIELAEQNDKLLIFCRYTLQIRAYEARLRELDYPVRTITGENSDEHFIITRDAENSEKAIVIAQVSVAAGWELPSFPVVVYASMSYSYLDFVQSRGRVIRGNKLSRHVFLYLWTGDIDKAVYESIMQKKDFDPLIYKPK
jgi:superfamily II DNA or RNA helicase